MIAAAALASVSDDTWRGLAVLVVVVNVAAMIGVVQAARDRKRRGASVAGFLALTKALAVTCVIAGLGLSIAMAKARGWIA